MIAIYIIYYFHYFDDKYDILRLKFFLFSIKAVFKKTEIVNFAKIL